MKPCAVALAAVAALVLAIPAHAQDPYPSMGGNALPAVGASEAGAPVTQPLRLLAAMLAGGTAYAGAPWIGALPLSPAWVTPIRTTRGRAAGATQAPARRSPNRG